MTHTPGPITRELSGIAKLPGGKASREVLTDALLDKYELKP